MLIDSDSLKTHLEDYVDGKSDYTPPGVTYSMTRMLPSTGVNNNGVSMHIHDHYYLCSRMLQILAIHGITSFQCRTIHLLYFVVWNGWYRDVGFTCAMFRRLMLLFVQSCTHNCCNVRQIFVEQGNHIVRFEYAIFRQLMYMYVQSHIQTTEFPSSVILVFILHGIISIHDVLHAEFVWRR